MRLDGRLVEYRCVYLAVSFVGDRLIIGCSVLCPIIGTKEEVVMEKKTIAGDPSTVPLVRGKGTIKGVRLIDFIPMVVNTGAREFWDARYVEGHALERYSRRSYKFYTLQK